NNLKCIQVANVTHGVLEKTECAIFLMKGQCSFELYISGKAPPRRDFAERPIHPNSDACLESVIHWLGAKGHTQHLIDLIALDRRQAEVGKQTTIVIPCYYHGPPSCFEAFFNILLLPRYHRRSGRSLSTPNILLHSAKAFQPVTG